MSFAIVPWRVRRSNGLTRRRPDPFAEMDRLFEGFFGNWPSLHRFGTGSEVSLYSPRVDLKETEGGFEVTAELPGLSAKEIDLSLTPGGESLVIKGEKKVERDEKKDGFHHLERVHGSFCREIPLPASVNEEAVEAKLEDGVLTVSLNKLEEEKNEHRRIEVKGA